MKFYNKSIGDYGENITENYLIKNGYKILKRNFKCKTGEIDLICLKDNVVSFIEVKSRFYFLYGTPCEAVTYSKIKRLINASNYFIYINKLHNHNVRFDVVEVFLNPENKHYQINHIEDAFRL